MMRKVLFFTSLLACASVQADINGLSWHGYISQGLTQSKDSLFITDNDGITGEITEVGLNGYYQVVQNISIAGQVNYLDGGNRFEQGARLDYFFIDWKLPNIGNGWQAQVHLGRFKNRHWLYSITRDVPQTRHTAVLPQSVYFDGFRDVALGSNGIQTSFSHYGKNNIWELNWSYGRSAINNSQRDFLLGEEAKGKIKQEFVHQASIYWQPSTMEMKIGASWLSSDFTYTAANVDNRLSGNASIQRFMLSAQYFSENWEVSSEILREVQDSAGLFAPDYTERRTGEGGFVQLRYLFNRQLSALVGYDTYTNDASDPDGKRLEMFTGGLIPAYFAYQDTVTLGFSYDIAPHLRLQGEHHWADGATRVVSLLDRNVASHADKKWKMWSLQLMYWF